MKPSTVSLLFVIFAVALSQIHLDSVTTSFTDSMPFGEYNDANFTINVMDAASSFAYKTTIFNGTAAHWSNVFRGQAGNFNFTTVSEKEAVELDIISPCDVIASGANDFLIHYGSAGATNNDGLNLDFEIALNEAETSISGEVEYWIENFSWVPAGFGGNTSVAGPTVPLMKFYDLSVQSNSSFNHLSVQLDLSNKESVPRKWSDFFKSMTVGSYDASCVLSGQVIDLADDGSADNLTRTSTPMQVSGNETLHMQLEVAPNDLWYTNELFEAFSFKVTLIFYASPSVSPSNPTSPSSPSSPSSPTSPTQSPQPPAETSSGLKAWQIALIVVGVVLVAVLIAALVFFCLRRRRGYETVA